MRKLAPMIRWHVTSQERQRIKRLTLARVPQATIARIIGLTAPSVAKCQRAMGLPTKVPTPEKQIVELFEKGWAGYRISKKLRCPANQVYAVAQKYGLNRRPDGAGNPKPKGDIAGFVQAVMEKRNYINHLRKQFGLGVCQANRLAHEVLGCLEFRPGASKPPLSSNFPQRNFDARVAGPADYEAVIVKVCEKCFNGTLPDVEDSAFVDAIIFGLQRTAVFTGMPAAVVEAFKAGLADALATLRQVPVGWTN
jgi:hypothetical protein